MLDVNSVFGREVLPASMIIKDMNIQGKSEIMQFLQQQEQQASQLNQEQTAVQHAFEQAKLQELTSRAANNLAMARERQGRADSNIGLMEERLSEISKNQSISTKSKMEALEKLIDVVAKYGEIETMLKMHEIQGLNHEEVLKENQARSNAQRSSNANRFVQELMGSMNAINASQNLGNGIQSPNP
jgi:DNA-directed RNA polymerase beta subunit